MLQPVLDLGRLLQVGFQRRDLLAVRLELLLELRILGVEVGDPVAHHLLLAASRPR